jgi:simple sugar transport system ATP-binding protein
MLKTNGTNYAIELKGITKTFGKVIANEDVNLGIKYGEILALLGENGSGKTTLMNILSGIYYADEGSIAIDGKEVFITNPNEAINLGIGMIYQHFKLVEVFNAMDNIVLGTGGRYVKNSSLKEKILRMSNKFGLEIEPDKKVYNMSVGEKQTIEIMKVLYRGAKILILDEPTSVLTPQETEKLFVILRKMKEQGNAIIIITHKLHEVLSISDRVAILRKGRLVDTVNTRDTNEKQLTELMVGRPISLEINRLETSNRKTVLKVVDLSVVNEDGTIGLNNINFKLKSGEILGVAGVAGSGQRELCETIAGLMDVRTGAVLYNKENIIGKTPDEIINLGISMSFVPEIRHGAGRLHGHGKQYAT